MGVGVIAGLIAAASAYALVMAAASPLTPVGKAIATALQYFGSGVAVVAVTELTREQLLSAGDAIVKLTIAAVAAGAYSFLTNVAEDAGTVTE